ncbi:MAG: DUF4209 domain-containing protein [Vicinamibacteria bacterium]
MTLQDAIKQVCSDLTSRASSPDPIEYDGAFAKRAKEAAAAGDEDLATSLRLLGNVFSMYFQFGAEGPFGPLAVFPNGRRTFLPEDLSPEQAGQLEELVDACDDPVFVARVADVLWIRIRKHEYARTAIRAYLESANREIDSWVPTRDYLKRAAQIAMGLGTKAPERRIVKEKIETLFERDRSECFTPDRGYWPAALAEILIENRLVANWERLGDECVAIAKGFPVRPGCDEPRRYYDLAATCYERARLPAKAEDAKLAIARHWEAEAAKFRTPEGGDGFQIAHRLERAIEAYRKAGGQQAKVAELMGELRRANELALSQMKPIGVPMDVEPLILEARRAMAGKAGRAAIEAFARLRAPAPYAAVREDVLRQSKAHPLSAMISTKVMVPEGNVAATVPGMLEDEEAKLQAMVVQAYAMRHDLAGATLLEEARSIVVSSEAAMWKAAVRELVEGSTFVPEDRRSIYERALVAGFEGDKMLFSHLVVPQLENSLRRVFREAGLQITSMDAQGVQEERDLNQLLRMEGAKDVLGEDLLWETRSLLIEKTGPNLRNRLCHGLLGDSDFERPAGNTLLWLTVFLLLGAKAALGGPVP